MDVRTNVKAGGGNLNHNESAVAVRTALPAGGRYLNHNESAVAVRSSLWAVVAEARVSFALVPPARASR